MIAALVLAAACRDDGRASSPPPSTTTTTVPATMTTAVAEPLATTLDEPADLPGFHVHRPADLDATGGPLPVVVWANGGCVRHDETWHVVLDGLAAAGNVVIAIAPPPPGSDLSAASSADDQAAAIDWAEAAGGEYAGRLDLDRVVAAGNSCGGITSLQLAARDDRVAAVFVLSGSSVGPGAGREAAAEVMSEVDVPVGFVVGGPQDIAGPAARQDVDVLPDDVPSMVVSRAEGDHVLVSTDEAILADVARIATSWLDLALDGDPAARDVLEESCPECSAGPWSIEAVGFDQLVEP